MGKSYGTQSYVTNISNLQNFKLNSTGDFADQSRNVLTTLFLYPGIGLSYGIAKTTYDKNHIQCITMLFFEHLLKFFNTNLRIRPLLSFRGINHMSIKVNR